MQDENINNAGSGNIDSLESEVREAVAKGAHIQETVQRLTLQAMNAQHVDLEYLRRIINAVLQGAHDGTQQKLQLAADQIQSAKSQITDAVTGLDTALAGFAQASKLAVEEAASQAKTFSDTELSRTRSDLEGLESLFLETLHNTATSAQGQIADMLHDLSRHAQSQGTAVGSQLKETLTILAQQMSSTSHHQIEAGASLAQSIVKYMGKITTGVLSGIAEHSKTGKQ